MYLHIVKNDDTVLYSSSIQYLEYGVVDEYSSKMETIREEMIMNKVANFEVDYSNIEQKFDVIDLDSLYEEKVVNKDIKDEEEKIVDKEIKDEEKDSINYYVFMLCGLSIICLFAIIFKNINKRNKFNEKVSSK